MTRIGRAVACVAALALVAFAASSLAPVGASDPASVTAAANAVAWIEAQQNSDGSFGPFKDFETRDAVLAIAEQAQSASTWNTSSARSAIEALKAGGSGPTPLDYLEGLFGSPVDQGVAAKTIVLVSAPLGIDPTAFGSVDLLDEMGGCSGTTSATFNGLLYVAIAQQLVCAGSAAANITAVRDAQQANGGWNFTGDPNGTDVDTDTTALAVEALVGSGADASDPSVHHALEFLAANFQSDGAWQSFGADDPNSTAMAILAITATGYDVTTSCWRDTVAPDAAGTPYTSPDTWLRSQQLTSGTDAGRVQSPNDSFGVNTFATSQSVEGLLRSWLPVSRAAAQTCAPPTTTTTSPASGAASTPVHVEAATVSAPTAAPADPAVRVQPRFTG